MEELLEGRFLQFGGMNRKKAKLEKKEKTKKKKTQLSTKKGIPTWFELSLGLRPKFNWRICINIKKTFTCLLWRLRVKSQLKNVDNILGFKAFV